MALPPGVSMVNVGGQLYRSDPKFNWESSDTGTSSTIDAAGAAHFLRRNPQMRRMQYGVWDYGGEVGAMHLAVDSSQEFVDQKYLLTVPARCTSTLFTM